MKEQEQKQQIECLLTQIYLLTYKEDVEITTSMENIMFKMHLAKDWRFKQIYFSYKKQTGEKIDIYKFIDKEIYNMFSFVIKLLDISKEEQPEQIYVDEEYPWRFEIIKDDAPTYEDFKIETQSIFLHHLKNIFNELTPEEIRTRQIKELTFRLNLIEERKKKREAKNKKKIEKLIYKYDSNGKVEKIYKSRKDCCEQENITKSSLSNHLAGRRKQIKGFVYKEIKK